MQRYGQLAEDDKPTLISFRATADQRRKIEALARAKNGNKSAALAALVDAAVVVVLEGANGGQLEL